MRSEPGRDHRSTDGGVVTQQARNLLMTLADRADGIKFLLRDQDTTFTAAFNAAFTAVGVRIIKTPVRKHSGLCCRCRLTRLFVDGIVAAGWVQSGWGAPGFLAADAVELGVASEARGQGGVQRGGMLAGAVGEQESV